jgi:hypothetical protein
MATAQPIDEPLLTELAQRIGCRGGRSTKLDLGLLEGELLPTLCHEAIDQLQLTDRRASLPLRATIA